MNEYKFTPIKMTPFKWFTLENFPFIEEDFDSLTSYGLWCKLKEYFNKVANATNEMGVQVENLTNAFNALKNYIDNYFDNLDVQEEINNKLDEMAEDGTLTDIITQYITDKIVRTYNTVADMKLDTSLTNGMKAKTLGYYQLNDGGGANYSITNNSSVNDYQELLSNNNYATLIIEKTMSVKQFGAKGDNINNDTVAFTNATTHCKNLIIPSGNYLIDGIEFSANSIITGENSNLNCVLNYPDLVTFNDNSIIKNININCLNDDREWNRIDFSDKKQITFENCSFNGFRQETLSPGAVGQNVWALYLKNCSDLSFINCNFTNNSFQDIFIEYGVNNLLFENINRTDTQKGVVIDIEPEYQDYVKNVTFINSNIEEFECFEYHNEMNKIQNVSIIDCIINKFHYSGGNVRIVNSPIKQYKKSDFLPFSGVLDLINSANFSKNLIDDPYMSSLSRNNENSYWNVSYASGNWKSMLKKIKTIKDGIFTSFNFENASVSLQVTSKPIQCNSNETFLVRTFSKSKYPTGGVGAIGKQCDILFYDENDLLLSTLNLSINRCNKDDVINFSRKSNIFTTPENCTYFKIKYRNAPQQSTYSLDLISCECYKLTFGDETNNITELPKIDKQEFNLAIVPNNNYINYFKDDIINFISPVDMGYIGAVATADGLINFGDEAVWKKFGALES